jgi:hypothetical protein
MKTLLFVGILTLALSSCDMGSSNTMITTDHPTGSDPFTEVHGVGPACAYNKSYVGFAGATLQAGRIMPNGDGSEPMGENRDRVKPVGALAGEYARVLGSTPSTLADVTNSYGLVPPRWFQEPEANAVSLYSSMRVAYMGCISYTTGSQYSMAPTVANAPALCAAFEKKFWSRDPDSDEINNCVNLAVNGTTDEPDPNMRWAVTCASVLSSADFLTF